MSAVEAHRFDERHWDALADEILNRQAGLEEHLRDGSPTPLEGLRRALRRKRRKEALRSVVLGSEPEYSWLRQTDSAAVEDLPEISSRQRLRRRAIALSGRAALLLGASALVMQLVMPSVNEAAARTILSLVPNGAIARIDAARRCVQARPVLDADGALVGVRPLHDCDTRLFLTAPVSAEAAAAMHWAWVVTEGEYRVSPVTVSGLNIAGWGRATLQYIGVLDGEQTGGSSPIETAIDNLLGRPGKLPLGDKLRAGVDTVTFTANHLGDDRERDRFVSENIPCLMGAEGSAFGYPLAGDLCSRFLFGKGAEELDWAERCLWVASAQSLFRIIGPGTPADKAEEARKVEAGIRQRSVERCLDKLKSGLNWSEEELARLRKRAEMLELPAGAPPVSEWHVSASVEIGRAMIGLAYVFGDQMKLASGSLDPGAIRLTVSAWDQQEAYHRVMDAAQTAARRLNPQLCLASCGAEDLPADLAVVLAEIDGERLRIRQAVTNGHFLLTGPIEADEKGYRRGRTTRSQASTNKLWLLPLLIAKGYDTLCNHVRVGASNPPTDPSPCADGEGLVHLPRAVARSLNPAFADAVRKLGTEDLRRYFQKIGFDVRAKLEVEGFVDGTVLGWGVTASPSILLRNFAALYRAKLGEEPASTLPSLVDAPAAERFDWREVGLMPADLRKAATVLSAPIVGDGGTLASLGPVLKRHGCTAAMGKTGTSEGTLPTAVRDKIVIAAFRCGNRHFVAYGMIGSPSLGIPLGDVRTSDVVRLIDAMLTGRLERGERS